MQLAEKTDYLKKFYALQIEQRHSSVSKELSYPCEIRQSCTLFNIHFFSVKFERLFQYNSSTHSFEKHKISNIILCINKQKLVQ
jgi:hypothetical protein